MSIELNRRDFVAAGIASGAAGVAALAPTAGAALADETASWEPPAWDYETEVLVVGYGGAGAVAAIEAFEQGAQVMAIEKGPTAVAGCSSLSACSVSGVKDVDKAVEYMLACDDGTTPEAVIRAFCEESTTVTEWFDDHGIPWEDKEGDAGCEFPNTPGADGLCVYQLQSQHEETNLGGNSFKRWSAEWAEENGVEVKLNTEAKELVQNPFTREIVGVRAVCDGEDVYIKAKKAVVLCTGGFESNPEMMSNFVIPNPLLPIGWPLNTGDGITMAQQVGAALWHMNVVSGCNPSFCDPEAPVGRMGNAGWLGGTGAGFYVNRLGKRFMCEVPVPFKLFHSNMFFCDIDWTRETPGTVYANSPFYVVFDETQRLNGGYFTPNILNGFRSLPLELGGSDHDWSIDCSEEIEMGWVLKADTIEELATKMDAFEVDPQTLRETLDAYNAACAEGVDAQFGRPAVNKDKPNLVALDNPPFYAIKLTPAIYSTHGGPVKNERSQIVDAMGNPIPRLYSAGILGSICSKMYSVSGMNFGHVFHWGRIAGRNAAAETPME